MEDNVEPSVTKELLRQWVGAAWASIEESVIKNAFECVGIGRSYVDEQGTYWRKLKSVQQTKKIGNLPPVRILIGEVRSQQPQDQAQAFSLPSLCTFLRTE